MSLIVHWVDFLSPNLFCFNDTFRPFLQYTSTCFSSSDTSLTIPSCLFLFPLRTVLFFRPSLFLFLVPLSNSSSLPHPFVFLASEIQQQHFPSPPAVLFPRAKSRRERSKKEVHPSRIYSEHSIAAASSHHGEGRRGKRPHAFRNRKRRRSPLCVHFERSSLQVCHLSLSLSRPLFSLARFSNSTFSTFPSWLSRSLFSSLPSGRGLAILRSRRTE